MNIRPKSLILLVLAAMILLNGCAYRPPHTSRFYVLNTIDGPQKADACADMPSLGINPLDLPKYLDRPQIMTRINKNELKLSESHQWAEPLKDTIPRVVACNVGSLMCGDVKVWPWKGSDQVDYRLNAWIIHLDGTPGGNAILNVRWSISDEHTKKLMVSKESTYREQVGENSYESLVSAYSRLLASFSRDIAASLAAVGRETRK
jgi:uncharacterized lipoprotein YmbA